MISQTPIVTATTLTRADPMDHEETTSRPTILTEMVITTDGVMEHAMVETIPTGILITMTGEGMKTVGMINETISILPIITTVLSTTAEEIIMKTVMAVLKATTASVTMMAGLVNPVLMIIMATVQEMISTNQGMTMQGITTRDVLTETTGISMNLKTEIHGVPEEAVRMLTVMTSPATITMTVPTMREIAVLLRWTANKVRVVVLPHQTAVVKVYVAETLLRGMNALLAARHEAVSLQAALPANLLQQEVQQAEQMLQATEHQKVLHPEEAVLQNLQPAHHRQKEAEKVPICKANGKAIAG